MMRDEVLVRPDEPCPVESVQNETSPVWIDSPLGRIWATADSVGITRLGLAPADCASCSLIGTRHNCGNSIRDALRVQLAEYFEGRRHDFDIPLHPRGTPFQQRVWEALRRIPYGQTRSYRELAQVLGQAQAARAVGQANRRNPIMILIPCHRVIAADGRLGGYAFGTEVKERLLDLERRLAGG